jgi:hypothetical protein
MLSFPPSVTPPDRDAGRFPGRNGRHLELGRTVAHQESLQGDIAQVLDGHRAVEKGFGERRARREEQRAGEHTPSDAPRRVRDERLQKTAEATIDQPRPRLWKLQAHEPE